VRAGEVSPVERGLADVIIRIRHVLLTAALDAGEGLEDVAVDAPGTFAFSPAEALRAAGVAVPSRDSLSEKGKSEQSGPGSRSSTALPRKYLGLPIWVFHFDTLLLNLKK